MQLIDSHAHIQEDLFPGEIDAIVARAKEHDILAIVNIGTSLSESKEMLDLASQYPGYLFPTVGLHPEDAEVDFAQYQFDELERKFRALAQAPGVVAIGECGLDWGKWGEHRSDENKAHQKQLLAMHITVAEALKLPLVIHCRNAWDDVLAQLEPVYEIPIVLHSFTGNRAVAERALARHNSYFSFSGIVTFPNAQDIQEAAKIIPDDRILVETDAPFLTPVPLRGQKNEPQYVHYTTRFLAELRKSEPEKTALITVENTKKVFHIAP